MRRLARSRPSPAMIVALVALFVALGGVSYAALAKNSVGTKQLKKNAVTTVKIKKNAVNSAKVADGSLLSADFAANQIPKGATGATGLTGATGKTGPAGVSTVAFARVDGNGALIGGAAQSHGVEAADIQHNAGAPAAESTGDGVYCFGALDFTPTSAIVTLDNTDSLPSVAEGAVGGSLNFITSVAIFKGEDLGRCDLAHGQARVAIERVDQTNPPALANHGFFIWFEG
jgi:hypothetical protein